MSSSMMSRICILLAALLLGACRGESLMIVRDIPPAQHAEYATLIPDLPGMSVPARPQMSVIGSMAGGDYYLEGVVQIRINYNGDDYWWPIYQPLNAQIGYDTGIPLGYPKKVQPMCHTDDGNYYTFSFGSCEVPELKLQHYTTNRIVTTYGEAPDTSDGTNGFMSLSEDGCLLNSGQTYANPTDELILREGFVYLENFLPQPWADLMPSGFYGGTLAGGTVVPLEEGQTDPNSDIDNPFYPIYEVACGF